jgi:Brp/Blh family beta-carotene 15,15'-monooxygenase
MRNYLHYILGSFILGITSIFLLNNELQNILALIAILSIGLNHGANDISIIQKFKIKSPDRFNFNKSVIIYSAVVVLTLLLFYLLPQLALWLFLIVSAYHFGEQHWASTIKKIHPIISFPFYTIYGLAVLFLLLYLNEAFAIEIIRQISANAFFDDYLLLITEICYIGVLLGVVLLSLYLKPFAQRVPLELLQLFTLYIIFKSGNLLFGFAFYFVIWHSLFSVKDQLLFLYGKLNKTNLLIYFKKSAVYWLISLIGLFVLVYLLNDKQYFYALMFAFIAAVTFPHVFVISKMMNRQKDTNSEKNKS